jgi:cell division protein FtsZ
MADEVLQQGVRGITDLMVMPGLINLDFADVRSVMEEMGKAMMGTGEAEGDGRALAAAEKAIANPLLDGVSMRGAKGVIVSITGGEDMRLMEVDEAANYIRELVDPDANIIWGSAFNENLNGKIRVSVVATGIDADAAESEPKSQPFRLGEMGAGLARPVQMSRPVVDPAPMPLTPPPVAAPIATLSEEEDELPPPHIIAAEPGDERDELKLEPPVVAATFDDGSGDDELVLHEVAETAPEPEPEPEIASPPPSRSVGGTLFERMSQLARGNARNEDEDESDRARGEFEVPRFLNRQNNQ